MLIVIVIVLVQGAPALGFLCLIIFTQLQVYTLMYSFSGSGVSTLLSCISLPLERFHMLFVFRSLAVRVLQHYYVIIIVQVQMVVFLSL